MYSPQCSDKVANCGNEIAVSSEPRSGELKDFLYLLRISDVKEVQFKLKKVLENNPSLKPKLKNLLQEAYFTARLKAVRETGLEEDAFPEESPWGVKEIFPDLDKKYC